MQPQANSEKSRKETVTIYAQDACIPYIKLMQKLINTCTNLKRSIIVQKTT